MQKLELSDVKREENYWMPPVVTVMGHVDHGKTTLLDTVRHSHIASGESGGITQHIGSYTIEFQGKKITFIDTPGHEAFSAMRSRGGRVADIVVLVIDAAEGVMPQTLEALMSALSYKVPIIVALNKIDLPSANSNMVKGQLAKSGLLVEGYGGDTVAVEISAKTGQNIDSLLEMIILTAQLNPSKGRRDLPLEAYVIESKLDRRRGPVASVVVKSGKISLGDEISAGTTSGRVKQLLDDKGERLSTVTPGLFVEVLGFNDVPVVGELVNRGKSHVSEQKIGLPIGAPLPFDVEGPMLKVILKADVMGSLEALKTSLNHLPLFSSQASVIFSGVGDVSDSDVNLAKAVSAVIFAFRVRVVEGAVKMAESLSVEIRSYQIIYKLTEDVEKALEGISAWKKSEGPGQALVLKIFSLNSGDHIFGCRVLQGSLHTGDRVKITRTDTEIGKSRIKSLKIGKEKVDKVMAEKECGALLTGAVGVLIGDKLEVI